MMIFVIKETNLMFDEMFVEGMCDEVVYECFAMMNEFCRGVTNVDESDKL
jgi:hypothetical protein